MKGRSGFTLIEIIVVIAIIGIIGALISIPINSAREKARDARRRVEITQIGRFLSTSCYLPDGGGGEYDLVELFEELKVKYPQFAKTFAQTPRDPKVGTDTESFYKYLVIGGGEECAIYANLENKDEPVTLGSISSPAAGGGTGVFEATSNGWNGSPKYLQISN